MLKDQILTSSQIAIKDKSFLKLFGGIWKKGGWPVLDQHDYALAELCKDMILQATVDWAINNKKKFKSKNKYNFIVESARSWIHDEKKDFLKTLDEKKHMLLKDYPLTFPFCCDTVGLDVEEAKLKIEYLRVYPELTEDKDKA